VENYANDPSTDGYDRPVGKFNATNAGNDLQQREAVRNTENHPNKGPTNR
jgi:hypothetical protein